MSHWSGSDILETASSLDAPLSARHVSIASVVRILKLHLDLGFIPLMAEFTPKLTIPKFSTFCSILVGYLLEQTALVPRDRAREDLAMRAQWAQMGSSQRRLQSL